MEDHPFSLSPAPPDVCTDPHASRDRRRVGPVDAPVRRGRREARPEAPRPARRGVRGERLELDGNHRVRGVLRRWQLLLRVPRHAGNCCGVVDDQSFCCPTAASSFGEGQCYRPDASTFRCRAAGTSRDSGDDRPSPWYSLFSLLIPVALLAACCMACFRKPRTQQPMPVGQQYYGQGAPPRGAVYGYPATGQPYQSGRGYGASNLAGAGAFPPPVPPPPLSVPDARAPSAPPLAQTTHYPAT